MGYSPTGRMVIVVIYLREELIGVNAWKATKPRRVDTGRTEHEGRNWTSSLARRRPRRRPVGTTRSRTVRFAGGKAVRWCTPFGSPPDQTEETQQMPARPAFLHPRWFATGLPMGSPPSVTMPSLIP